MHVLLPDAFSINSSFKEHSSFTVIEAYNNKYLS